MRSRLVPFVVVASLLWTTPAEAQRLVCGGHRIEWVGGTPGRSFSGGPPVDRTPGGAGSGGSGGSGGYGPTHYDGAQPTIAEPAGMEREHWEGLVFGAHDYPDRHFGQTIVLDRATVPTIGICIPSADTSALGAQLAKFADAAWWRHQINYWTNLSWNGELRVAACTDDPPPGWIYVREGRPGKVAGSANTQSGREGHAHGAGRWIWSEIVWNPDFVNSRVEEALVHELGHALGFFHTPPGSGGFMEVGGSMREAAAERSLAHLAYMVGPNVRYPGLVRADTEEYADLDHPDRAALMALFRATDGNNWSVRTNWGAAEPLGRWHGVTTDSAGRVAHLDLHSNNLTGPIPPELGDLINLTSLRLDGNALTGPLPAELGNLVKLEHVYLYDNDLRGQILPAVGGLLNVETLEILSLARNNLTGPIPPELGDLVNLESLDLSRNYLTGPIPPELGGLVNLERLVLARNGLTGSIPAELSGLANLKQLWLYRNGLTGPIPPELSRLSQVWVLSLRDNALTGQIPPELGNLVNLADLSLSDNNLTGEVPPELGYLMNLWSLWLGGNNLTGPLPRSLTNLRQIDQLNIEDNAGLCAPADDVFQAWLATLADFRGETCAAAPVPALPAAGLAVAALLLGGLGTGALLFRSKQARPNRSMG